MRRHPKKHELMALAESQVDGFTPSDAEVAAHVAECPACHKELDQMLGSLDFVAMAEELEPTRTLNAQLLLAARSEMAATKVRRRHGSAFYFKAVACTACFVLIAFTGIYGPADLGVLENGQERLADGSSHSDAKEAASQVTTEIDALIAAVRSVPKEVQTLREHQQRRTLAGLDADLAVALSALERNPGCVRASHVVDSKLKRQANTLRTLYFEQSF